MNPEQIKQERERVNKLLKKAGVTPDEAWVFFAEGTFAGEIRRASGAYFTHLFNEVEGEDGIGELAAAAPTLAHAYLAALDTIAAQQAQLAELEKLTVYAQDAERARLQQAEAHMRTHMRASMYDGTAAQVHQFYAMRLAEITGNKGHLAAQEAQP